MDKQNQINEMAKVIEEAMSKARRTLGGHNNISKFYATMLVNAGFRKIPENAVVIELHSAFDCINARNIIIAKSLDETFIKRFEVDLLKTFKQARKETAEKFAEQMPEKVTEFLEEKLKDGDFVNGKTALIEFTVAIVKHIADEICKEISEGKDGRM